MDTTAILEDCTTRTSRSVLEEEEEEEDRIEKKEEEWRDEICYYICMVEHSYRVIDLCASSTIHL